ncbi:MAG: RNA methyltransferase [Bacteroidales bacterium]|nr:RNA methyltransferase [Bacteroidales bacterium]
MNALKIFEQGMDLTAKTFSGMEDVLAGELSALGAKDITTGKRVVFFRGDQSMIYKANYQCRTALRILKPIGVFTVRDENELYEKVQHIDWPSFFTLKQTFVISASVFNSKMTHSQYVAQKTKDAIVDQFRNKFGRRPNVDKDNPTLSIDVHINGDQCTLSLDSSGPSLHKRGYRTEVDKAPLNEALAAGLIQLSGWDKNGDFMDPMCGSGTLPIEAAMYAMNIPAGYYRKHFAFQNWPDFDEELWKQVKQEADEQIIEHDFPIYGSDQSYKAFRIAQSNVKSAQLHKDITVINKPFEKMNPESGKGILLFNPPYGERLKENDIISLYKHIGDVLKTKFKGYEAWIITSNLEAAKFIGLKPTKKITVYNGPLESRFLKFEIYAGSKKAAKQ